MLRSSRRILSASGRGSSLLPASRIATRRFANLEPNGRAAQQAYMIAQRQVDFPPKGRFIFYFLALVYGGFSANSILTFYEMRDSFDEALRKAIAGEVIFGTNITLKSMRMLVDIIDQMENLHENPDDFPNFIPRLLNNGGLEAIMKSLDSSNHELVCATVDLVCAASRRPKAAKTLVNSPNMLQIMSEKATIAAEQNLCPSCSSPIVMQNLEFLATALQYYSFSSSSSPDNSSTGDFLAVVSNGIAKFAQQAAEMQDALSLLLEPPFGDLSNPNQFDSLVHLHHQDVTWHVHAIDLLLKTCLNTLMANPQALPVVDRALPGLSRLYEADLMTDEQALYFGLLCMEALPLKQNSPLLSKREPGFEKAVEEFNHSRFVNHPRYRKMAKTLLNNAEFFTRVLFAGSFGYIWGVTRTLFALRNVVPTNASAPVAGGLGLGGNIVETSFRSGIPLSNEQTPVTSPHSIIGSRRAQIVEPRAWRWMMARQHGGLAALGALSFVAWEALLTGPLGWNLYLEDERIQVASKIGKTVSSIGLVGILLQRTPFFVLPAFAATTLTNPHDDSIQFTVEWWPPSPPGSGSPPFPPGPEGGGGSSPKGGRWA